MIPDVSFAISWLKSNYKTLKNIRHGIEREGLRIDTNGRLAQTSHPMSFGSPLTHKWITTDFSEALMEFITPNIIDIKQTIIMLRDIHRYVVCHLGHENIWPMSIPCLIGNDQSIKLAQYGKSNIGRMKTIYRKGLKNRYNIFMQITPGIHYNFSFPLDFWIAYSKIHNETNKKEVISTGYLRLIRNYYRFGWIIPYLFGSSPGIHPSVLNEDMMSFPFKHASSEFIYLPYATSLRLSNLWYINKFQNQVGIAFNSLKEYVHGLRNAMKTPSMNYQKIGIRKNGHYLQLNTNILQIESELYLPIRPRRVIKDNESLSDALMRDGIEYIEVRSLDVNPFSPIGIDEDQAYLIDLFLIWCILVDAPKMNSEELIRNYNNWNLVILEGRKPGLLLDNIYDNTKQLLTTIGKLLFVDLRKIAEILDKSNKEDFYQQVCDKLMINFDYPEYTFSSRLLDQLMNYGIVKLGLMLSEKYKEILCKESFQILSELQFEKEKIRSLNKQRFLEESDKLSFDEFLENQIK